MCMKNVIIYVDGACSNNGKVNAIGGYGIYFPNKEFNDVSKKFTLNPITNNRAELWAIYEALEILGGCEYDNATIYSDSKYSVNCINVWYETWEKNKFLGANKKPVDNLDIIDKIMGIVCDKVKIEYVRRENNKEADKLAKDGCKL